MLSCDAYLMPGSLAEAFDVIERHRGGYRLVAGATDLLPYARQGRGGDVHYPALIDLSRVKELSGIERRGNRIRMGANTTIAAFLDNPLLTAGMPVMRHCAMWFADDQIRAAATVAGNVVNASPAADTVPPLLAMNATIGFQRRVGGAVETFSQPLGEFILGPGRTTLPEDAIVTHFDCDAVDGYGGAFEKVGHRRSLVISTVCLAALVRLDPQCRRFADVRLALGAVGPVPQRLTGIEAALIGRPADRSSIEAALDTPGDWVHSRSRREYRREVVVNFIRRGLVDALAEAGVAVEGEGRGGTQPEVMQHA